MIVIWGIFVILQALHNTRMINLYSTMDTRVKVLGYAIKVFAKVYDLVISVKISNVDSTPFKFLLISLLIFNILIGSFGCGLTS